MRRRPSLNALPGVSQSACAEPGGTLAATGGDGGRVQIWDLRTGGMLHEYTDLHSDTVTRLRFQPDFGRSGEGLRLISAAEVRAGAPHRYPAITQ